MCGDGGNDCGALRAAHAGVALSDAEASIVAPFSSKNPSIFSIVDTLRFGRGTLASSFATYKCMILWGQVCTTISLFKNYYFISMVEANWVMVDAVLCIAMSSALTFSRPSPNLSTRRPTVSLLGASTLSSCIGLVLINFIFVTICFLLLEAQDWYVQFDPSLYEPYMWWELADNYEASMIYVLMVSQISNTAVVFNFGDVFRESWCKNWKLVLVWLAFQIYLCYLILTHDNDIVCYFKVNCGDSAYTDEFRFILFVICLLNVIAVFVWERFVVLGPVAEYFRNRVPRSRFIRL